MKTAPVMTTSQADRQREQKGRRTGLDFSQHNLIMNKTDDLAVYYLRKPNTVCDSVKFINVHGILAVTGDYGNWIFCREFHPGPKGFVSDGYWREKLNISSCQEPEKYDSEKTAAEIRSRMKDPELTEEENEYFQTLLLYVDEEINYMYHAFNDMPNGWDYESIPVVKSVDHWLLVVFDAFDEICHRLNSNLLQG